MKLSDIPEDVRNSLTAILDYLEGEWRDFEMIERGEINSDLTPEEHIGSDVRRLALWRDSIADHDEQEEG